MPGPEIRGPGQATTCVSRVQHHRGLRAGLAHMRDLRGTNATQRQHKGQQSDDGSTQRDARRHLPNGGQQKAECKTATSWRTRCECSSCRRNRRSPSTAEEHGVRYTTCKAGRISLEPTSISSSGSHPSPSTPSRSQGTRLRTQDSSASQQLRSQLLARPPIRLESSCGWRTGQPGQRTAATSSPADEGGGRYVCTTQRRR